MGGSLPKIAGFAAEDQNPGYRSGMFPDNGLTNSKGVPYIWGPGFPIENTSGGVRKRTKASSPTSKRVAALLKTKDTSNNKDSGDKLG